MMRVPITQAGGQRAALFRAVAALAAVAAVLLLAGCRGSAGTAGPGVSRGKYDGMPSRGSDADRGDSSSGGASDGGGGGY